MNPIEAVSMVGANPVGSAAPIASLASSTAPAGGVKTTSFSELLGQGVAHVEQKIDTANDLVRAFALDDSVPIHQVTIAIEEARIAVDLALQVRTRLTEAYREIMNTQL